MAALKHVVRFVFASIVRDGNTRAATRLTVLPPGTDWALLCGIFGTAPQAAEGAAVQAAAAAEDELGAFGAAAEALSQALNGTVAAFAVSVLFTRGGGGAGVGIVSKFAEIFSFGTEAGGVGFGFAITSAFLSTVFGIAFGAGVGAGWAEEEEDAAPADNTAAFGSGLD